MYLMHPLRYQKNTYVTLYSQVIPFVHTFFKSRRTYSLNTFQIVYHLRSLLIVKLNAHCQAAWDDYSSSYIIYARYIKFVGAEWISAMRLIIVFEASKQFKFSVHYNYERFIIFLFGALSAFSAKGIYIYLILFQLSSVSSEWNISYIH